MLETTRLDRCIEIEGGILFFIAIEWWLPYGTHSFWRFTASSIFLSGVSRCLHQKVQATDLRKLVLVVGGLGVGSRSRWRAGLSLSVGSGKRLWRRRQHNGAVAGARRSKGKKKSEKRTAVGVSNGSQPRKKDRNNMSSPRNTRLSSSRKLKKSPVAIHPSAGSESPKVGVAVLVGQGTDGWMDGPGN